MPAPDLVRRIGPWPGIYGALWLYFLGIQLASDRLACIDVFYHIRLARLMWESGFIRDFPWMQCSVFRTNWVDQHFLFHVLLIPFTWIPDLFLGAKLSSAAFAAAALTTFAWFLRRRQVPYPLFWLLLLVGSSPGFLYRMNMVRGQSVAIVLFLLYLDALFERRARRACLIAFVFVWMYQLFLLLLPLTAAIVLAEFRERRRPALGPPAAGLAGLLAGLIVNPFFPGNLSFLYQHAAIKVLNRARLPVGGEWGPFDSWTLLTANLPVYGALAAAGGLLLVRPGRVGRVTLALAMVAAMFFVMHLHSRRFIEYWPPFALLFAASAIADLGLRAVAGSRRIKVAAAAVAALVLLPLAARNHRLAIQDLDANLPPDRYRDAAQWLAAESAEGEIVFTTDWDDFAELFFYNTRNRYLVGLDPTLMLIDDSTLYYEWEQIANGQLGSAGASISRDFGARFVFTDHAHEAFLERAEQDPTLRPVFRNSDCSIFQVVSAEESADFRIEGEARFPPLATSGCPCRIQNLRAELGVSSSNDRILFVRAVAPGDFVEFEVFVPVPGTYAVRAGLVTAEDYGVVEVAIDGEPLGPLFDGYSPRVAVADQVRLGERMLAEGRHGVRLSVTGQNPAARGFFVGLDYLELEVLAAAP